MEKRSEGILLLNKPPGRTSFSLIPKLRYIFSEKKIGHGGTLDPLATGVMVYLIGKKYTTKAETFLFHDKEYEATILLGEERDSYDTDGTVIARSSLVPTKAAVEECLQSLSGEVDQLPPMVSAKKVGGQRLYALARAGKEVERKTKRVNIAIELLSYNYPYVEIKVVCSSGTYIRSIAHDAGILLGCYGCISALKRTRSGPFTISSCYNLEEVELSDDALSLLTPAP